MKRMKFSTIATFIFMFLFTPISTFSQTFEISLGSKNLFFLPRKSPQMFPRLYADPYDTQLSLSKSLEEDRYIGRIGQTFYLLHLHPDSTDTQRRERGMYLGLTGYSWTLLDRDGNKFPLMAVDYLIAGFMDFHYRKLAVRLKYSHISAHLGDKFFGEADASNLPRIYSREFVSGYIAARWKPILLYGAWHWIYHRIPDVNPLNFQLGTVIDFGEPLRKGFSPYLAANAEWVGEFDYTANISAQIGARLFYQNGKAYRLALNYYSGYHQFGQYYDSTAKSGTIGIYLDY